MCAPLLRLSPGGRSRPEGAGEGGSANAANASTRLDFPRMTEGRLRRFARAMRHEGTDAEKLGLDWSI